MEEMRILALWILASLVSEIEPDYDRLVMDELEKGFSGADRDLDGKLNVTELISWFVDIDKAILEEDTDQEWKSQANKGDSNKFQWHNYIIDWCSGDDGKDSLPPSFTNCFTQMKRKAHRVDKDNDGRVSKAELREFLFPQSSPDESVKEAPLWDYISKLDKDNNGLVSQKEYLTYNNDFSVERQTYFQTQLDKDKNLMLDQSEIKSWLMGTSRDALITELIQMADLDEDGRLSRRELLGQHQAFLILLPRSFFDSNK